MKYIVGIIVLALIAFGAWYYYIAPKQQDAPEEARTAVASGHPEWAPIMFAQNGTIVGAGPELVAKIMSDLNVSVSFPESGTWDEVQAKARSGAVDILVAAYKTDERLTYMEYSDAYTQDPIVLFVKKGATFTFEKNEDLVGKHGVALVGDSYGQTFDDFAAANLDLARASTTEAAFAEVEQGTADYFIYTLYGGEDYMKKSNKVGAFEALAHIVDAPNFYITISKQSPLVDLMPKINERIAAYKADGTIDALITKYKQ